MISRAKQREEANQQNDCFNRDILNQAYRYCIALTKNEDDAYDLLQTSSIKYLDCDGKTREKAKAYFFRIIRNQFIDEQRKSQKYQFEEFNEDINIACVNPGPLDMMISKEMVSTIMDLLSVPERELLYLWGIEEYTVQEIADLTETPKGTLLSRLFRLKKKIIEQINLKSS